MLRYPDGAGISRRLFYALEMLVLGMSKTQDYQEEEKGIEMSVVIETLVFCDGCNANFSGDDRSSSAGEIRKERKKVGWVQKGSKDYCAECWEKMRKALK